MVSAVAAERLTSMGARIVAYPRVDTHTLHGLIGRFRSRLGCLKTNPRIESLGVVALFRHDVGQRVVEL